MYLLAFPSLPSLLLSVHIFLNFHSLLFCSFSSRFLFFECIILSYSFSLSIASFACICLTLSLSSVHLFLNFHSLLFSFSHFCFPFLQVHHLPAVYLYFFVTSFTFMCFVFFLSMLSLLFLFLVISLVLFSFLYLLFIFLNWTSISNLLTFHHQLPLLLFHFHHYLSFFSFTMTNLLLITAQLVSFLYFLSTVSSFIFLFTADFLSSQIYRNL